MLDTVLGAGVITANKESRVPGVYILVGKKEKQGNQIGWRRAGKGESIRKFCLFNKI